MCFSDSGNQLNLSFVSGAVLLAYPATDAATLLAQFKVVFGRGFMLCPLSASVATLANPGNALISWWSNDGACMVLRFFLAGLCTASVVPFSLLFFVDAESHLLEKAAEIASATQRVDQKSWEGKSSPSAAQTRNFIREWCWLNYIRILFPLIRTLLSYSAF